VAGGQTPPEAVEVASRVYRSKGEEPPDVDADALGEHGRDGGQPPIGEVVAGHSSHCGNC